MRIVVVGAGVVGVTTAYALQKRGHQVTVVDSHEDAGLETSKANAGQRSYGVVYPFASAAMVKKALPWLLKKDGPLKMRMPPSMATVRFLLATLRFAYAPGMYQLNRRNMLRLGIHSRESFAALEEDLELAFDGDNNGLLQLASTPAALAGYQASAVALKELGIAHQLLRPEEVRDVEPGLTSSGALCGALHYKTDGTGDCQLFSQTLAAACRTRGVEFLFGRQVQRFIGDQHRLAAIDVSSDDAGVQQIEADAFVVSAGCASPALVADFGLRLPIYPIKGYSLTAPLIDASKAPVSTVLDDNFNVVCTRLGNRLRATGFVELAGYDRSIPDARVDTIKRAVASRFPGAADLETAQAWTGFRPMTPDGPPVIGRGPRENLYLNTGHGTFGWTLSAGSAELIAQVIDGETPAMALDAFRPERYGE